MQKILLRLFILFILAPFAYCDVNPIVDDQGHVHSSVVSIIRKYSSLLSFSDKIVKERLEAILSNAEPTLQELNILAQDKFLRPKGHERFDAVSIQHYITMNKDLTLDQKNSIIDDFKKLGDIDEIKPKLQVYDYILILGSTVNNMRDRTMYVADLYKKGDLRQDNKTTIMFLTGDRKLFESETEQVLLDPQPYAINPEWKQPLTLPTNENESGSWVYEQLDLPQQMRSIPIQYIKSGKRDGQNRAQTNDTIIAWAEKALQNTDPSIAKNCLIVSSNPLINYQVLTVKATLAKLDIKTNFNLEGIGPGAKPAKYDIDHALGILLDNLARTIYTQIEFIKIQNSQK